MATDLYTVTLKAESKGVVQTKQQMDSLGKSTGLATKAIGLFGAAFAAAGIGSAFKKITTDTMAFTKSISELSAITGATGKDLKFYEEQAALIGKTTTLSASQAATAFKLIASAKPDLLENAEALAAVTKEAVTLAEAAGVGLADAASTVGVSLNQFGADASEAARFVNVLAAGAKEGSSSITDTSMAMKNAGVAAKLAGLSFEEANVGIQLLAKGGLFAAEAGTGFRQVLLKLENEAEDKFKPSMVGLAGALENLAAEEMSLTELTSLFGAEAMKSAAVMIAGAGDARTLEEAITGTSTATEMAATNFDNMTGDMLTLNSANEGLAITLGKMLEPTIRSVIQSVTDFSLKVEEFISSDKFIRYLDLATKLAKAFSIIIGLKLVLALGAAVTSFASAATAATLFGRAVTLAGGPISIGVMGLWALYEILQKVTGVKANKLAKELQIAALSGVAPLTKHIKELKIEQERLTQATNNGVTGTMSYRRQFANLQITTEALSKAEKVLEEQMDLVSASTDVSTEAADNLAAEFENLQNNLQSGLSPEMLTHIEITQNQTDEYKELTLSLSQQLTQVKMNKREQFLYSRQLQLGADATMAERLAVESLSGALFDAEVEQKKFTDAENKMTRATVELTDAQELHKNMIENVQSSFGDLIYKTLDDGKLNFKSFFNSVLDGFKRLIAELLAKKIMNAIFGEGGLTGFLSSLSGGFGSIMSGISQGLGGIVGGFASSISSLASTALSAVTNAASAVTSALIPAATSAATTAVTAAVVPAVTSAATTAVTTSVLAAGGSAAGVSSIAGGMAAAGAAVPVATTVATTAAGVASIEAGMAAAGGSAVTGGATTAAGGAGTGLLATLGPAIVFALVAKSMLGKEGVLSGQPITKMTPELAARQRLEMARNTLAEGGEGSDAVMEDAIAQALALGIDIDGAHAAGLRSVPYDGYIAELHAGERVQTAAQAEASDRMTGQMIGLRNNLNDLMMVVAKAVSKTARIEDRWDKNGLPPVRA
tara:strand:+ start:8312 stop:11326 length:3015 start_codon:yes stop_codon:yes gene_type:complete